MKTENLTDILAWIKTTDLTEVSWHEGSDGFSFSTPDPYRLSAQSISTSRRVPVYSPSIGVLQWNELGKPRIAEEGALVSSGRLLAVLETGKGPPQRLLAPADGRVAKVFVEAGQPVQYGQLLFLIEAVAA